MTWQFATDRPIYVQLTERISLSIISGAYPPGSRLPSVRELAAQAGVNPNTMQRALSDLESAGLIYTERTSGRFVTEDQGRIAAGRQRLATQIISEFFRSMAQLGVNIPQALAMAAEAKEMEI